MVEGSNGENTQLDLVILDSNLTEKAFNCYTVGDTANLDIASHHYSLFKICNLTQMDDGATFVSIEKINTTNPVITENISLDSEDNWLWVPNKSFGEPVTQSFYAHTEGINNQATGLGAHAEGKDCKALGNHAHAEGRQTLANYAAHAEGRKSVASGLMSHAEGYGTNAGNEAAHAEGYSTKATGFASHSEGNQTNAEGEKSHAEGLQTVAIGPVSHSEGVATKAIGYCSHAEGENTIASGDYAHTGGTGTVASGDRSFAIGESTIAVGYAQAVVGRYNIEDTGSLFVVGNGSNDGNRNTAFKVHSAGHAEVDAQGSTDKSVVIKQTLDAKPGRMSGSGEIFNNYADNKAAYLAHAEGNNTQATGSASHTEGAKTIASNDCAHAEGDSTTASGSRSHAEGLSTVASGYASHAEGEGTQAKGNWSHAGGFKTIAGNAYQTVVGKHNVNEPGSLFEVGNGDYSTKKNAFTVYDTGYAEVQAQGQTTTSVVTVGHLNTSLTDMESAMRLYVNDTVTDMLNKKIGYGSTIPSVTDGPEIFILI